MKITILQGESVRAKLPPPTSNKLDTKQSSPAK